MTATKTFLKLVRTMNDGNIGANRAKAIGLLEHAVEFQNLMQEPEVDFTLETIELCDLVDGLKNMIEHFEDRDGDHTKEIALLDDMIVFGEVIIRREIEKSHGVRFVTVRNENGRIVEIVG